LRDVATFAQADAVVLEFHSRLVLSGWDGFARSDHEVVDAQEVVTIYEPALILRCGGRAPCTPAMTLIFLTL
jgi:hypothetical protein